jgi:hypothetical protein
MVILIVSRYAQKYETDFQLLTLPIFNNQLRKQTYKINRYVELDSI